MKIKFRNFRCHRSAEFEFANSGLALLSGASGLGKSSVLEGIVFALYGEIRKPYSFGAKSCSVELWINDLHITRSRRPNRLIIVDEKTRKQYEDEGAQHYINQKLRMNSHEFGASSYVKQKNNTSILTLTPTEQLHFVEKLAFEGDDHTTLKKLFKQAVIDKKKQLDETNTLISYATSHLQTLKEKEVKGDDSFSQITDLERLERLVEEKEIDSTQLKRYLEELTHQHSDLASRLVVAEAEFSNKSKIEGERKKLKHQLEILNQQLDEIELPCNHEEIHCQESELESVSEELRLTKIYDEYIQDRDRLEELKKRIHQKLTEKRNQLKSVLLDEEKITEYRATLEECCVEKPKLTQKQVKERLNELIERIKKETDFKIPAKTVKGVKGTLARKQKTIVDHLPRKKRLIEKMVESVVKSGISSVVMSCPECETGLILEDGELRVATHPNKEVGRISTKNLQEKLEEMKNNVAENEEFLSGVVGWLSEFKELESHLNDDAANANKTISPKKYAQIQTEVLAHESGLKQYQELDDQLKPDYLDPTLQPLADGVENLKKQFPDDFRKKRDVEKLESSISIHEEEIEAYYQISSSRSVLTHEIDEKTKHLSALNKKLGQTIPRHDLNRLRRELSDVDVQIGNTQGSLLENQEQITGLTAYRHYLEWKIDVDEAEGELEDLQRHHQSHIRHLIAAEILKRKSVEAEVVALTRMVAEINMRASYYLEMMFIEPICVTIESIKRNQKGDAKFQLNSMVNYQGCVYDNINQLSGGEYQRVMLSFQLAINDLLGSPILMLDECLNNLDAELNTSILGCLKEVSNNKLILVVSHEAVQGIFDSIHKF